MKKILDCLFGIFLLLIVLVFTIADFILKPFGIKIVKEVS